MKMTATKTEIEINRKLITIFLSFEKEYLDGKFNLPNKYYKRSIKDYVYKYEVSYKPKIKIKDKVPKIFNLGIDEFSSEKGCSQVSFYKKNEYGMILYIILDPCSKLNRISLNINYRFGKYDIPLSLEGFIEDKPENIKLCLENHRYILDLIEKDLMFKIILALELKYNENKAKFKVLPYKEGLKQWKESGNEFVEDNDLLEFLEKIYPINERIDEAKKYFWDINIIDD